ncbi:MAG: hypothetical protein GC134_06455 [Proteobacteria bacterium]|nr:hypothetical protein [Pseudomonadota bacterium]
MRNFLRVGALMGVLMSALLLAGCGERPTETRAIDANGTKVSASQLITMDGLDEKNVNTPNKVTMAYTDAKGEARTVTVSLIYSDELLYTYVNKDGTLVDRMRRGAGEQLRKALIPEGLRDAANGLRSELSDVEVLISANRMHYLGRKGKDTYRLVLPSGTKARLVLLTLPSEGVHATFSVVLDHNGHTFDVPTEILN